MRRGDLVSEALERYKKGRNIGAGSGGPEGRSQEDQRGRGLVLLIISHGSTLRICVCVCRGVWGRGEGEDPVQQEGECSGADG